MIARRHHCIASRVLRLVLVSGRRKASFVEVDRSAYVARCTTVAIAVVLTEVPQASVSHTR